VPALIAKAGLGDNDVDDRHYMLYIMFGVPPMLVCILRTLIMLTCFTYDTPMYYVL
jgi:hypothetical protein